jgi:hypothetical protein
MKTIKTTTGVKATIDKDQSTFTANLSLLKEKGIFLWEGYGRNRTIRTTKILPGTTLDQTIYEKNYRSHNIDLVGNTICIENSHSGWCVIQFDSEEDAALEYLNIVGQEFKDNIENTKLSTLNS